MHKQQKQVNLKMEAKRMYQWIDPMTGNKRVYDIYAPVVLHVGKTTHRVIDSSGLVHCVPSVGYFGCVVCWVNKPLENKLPDQHSCLKD